MLFFSLYARKGLIQLILQDQEITYQWSVSAAGSFIFDNVRHAGKFGSQRYRFVCATS
jgi:hypothetical protein